ncbi:MAG: hypothetical protein A2V65_10985 [Deltaproteobacteria bacterium RBG_13_49_15]|nr:MAG: hypothetical protein A2V65_10985 [Deltaproteobacteria bacterium RBG_13_49_15]
MSYKNKFLSLKTVIYFMGSILMTIIVSSLLFRIVSFDEVTSLIRNIALAPTVCFIILSLTHTMIQTWRYSILLASCRISLPISTLFLVTTVRNLFSDLLPARVGSLSYVLILTGRLEVRIDKALSGFILAFVFDMLAIFPLLLLSLFVSNKTFLTEWFIIIFLIVSGIALCATLRYLSKLFRLFGRAFRFFSPLTKTADRFDDTARQVDDIKKSGVYVQVFLLSIAGRIYKYGKLFFLLLALLSSQGYTWREIGLARFFLSASSAEFAASLPISGIAAFGAYEGAWAMIFSVLGFPKQLAVSTGISHHLITQVYGYSLGVMALLLLMIPGIGKAKPFSGRRPPLYGFFVRLSLFVASTIGMLFLSFTLGSHMELVKNENGHQRTLSIKAPAENPVIISEQEKKAIVKLSGRIKGHILFTKSGRVFRQKVGEWIPMDLGEGDYARWDPSGKRIAVYRKGEIFVMQNDGKGKKRLLQIPNKTRNCPIEFHTNGIEILFINPDKGLWAVRIDNGTMRPIETSRRFDGEPGISSKGDRIAIRQGHRLYSIDLERRHVKQYGRGCSPGGSPDGKKLMQNRDGHKEMLIRNFDGDEIFKLDAGSCLPDGKWDNHHWSNHDDYIAAQGNGEVKDAYVVSVSENRGYRVTWSGDVRYPDLHIQREGS